MITAADFENAYAAAGGMTVERLRELGRVVLPCDCGDEICEGWQSLNREFVHDEIELRGYPKRAGWLCAGCKSWIDPEAPRAFDVERGSAWRGDVAILTDGAELFRVGVFHQRCSSAGVLSAAAPGERE